MNVSEESLDPTAPPPAVLVVDDDADTRRYLAQLLNEFGYIVHTARDGVAAMRTLRSDTRPSAVLLDLMMPVMTGWEVLEAMERDEALASVPVIVISAAPRRVLEGCAANRPCLSKPFSLSKLLEALERCGIGRAPPLGEPELDRRTARPPPELGTADLATADLSTPLSDAVSHSVAMRLSGAMEDLEAMCDALEWVADTITDRDGIDARQLDFAARAFRAIHVRSNTSLSAIEGFLTRLRREERH